MPKQRILVTGGAGFIGSNFCNYHADQFDITALDNLFLGDPDHLSDNVTFVEGDACNPETLQSLGSFQYIIHFAGTSSAPMFAKDIVWSYRNSIESFLQILEHAVRTGTTKVLYASTSSIYANNPTPLTENQQVSCPNHYSVTKRTMEEIANNYVALNPSLDVIGFRFMSVYGAHEEHKGVYANVISQFIWGMMRGEPAIIYGDGTQTRDFTSVIDVVKAITLALESDKRLGSNVFNIGTAKSVNLNNLISTINKVMGTSITPQHIINPLKGNYINSQLADITKISQTLGYKPSIELEEGITLIVENLRSRSQKSLRDRTAEANVIPK